MIDRNEVLKVIEKFNSDEVDGSKITWKEYCQQFADAILALEQKPDFVVKTYTNTYTDMVASPHEQYIDMNFDTTYYASKIGAFKKVKIEIYEIKP